MARILYQTRFQSLDPGWDQLSPATPATMDGDGLWLDPSAGPARLHGPGIHTRNGDVIELHFDWTSKARGMVRLGFSGGMEAVEATVDFKNCRAELRTSDWSNSQPVETQSITVPRSRSNVLRLARTEGGGDLVKLADFRVELNGKVILGAANTNVLPETGVAIQVSDAPARLTRFVHRGEPTGLPEYLAVGAWAVLNKPDIAANLDSICRGLQTAADRGIQLLVTPETSLTGLFPTHQVTRAPRPVAAAERKLRRFIKSLKNAPYSVVGMPSWESVPDRRRSRTRYNVSRVYDPDGDLVDSYAKIHSCEREFWHGYRLQEFDVFGVPTCMHICHDGRYPETWTLPVMFGARLILHPSNGGTVGGSVDAMEKIASRSTTTSGAFYVHVNGGGGSYIAGPQKFDNILGVSSECRRDNRNFPMVGPPEECLVESILRIPDAYGYWPVRSFRASEEVASAQMALYRSLGGKRV